MGAMRPRRTKPIGCSMEGELLIQRPRFWGVIGAGWTRCTLRLFDDYVEVARAGGETISFPLKRTILSSCRPNGRSHCFCLVNLHDTSVDQHPRLVFAAGKTGECGTWMRAINHNMTNNCGGLMQLYCNLV